MSNLKIGSFALVIKANNPENIGKVVEVIDINNNERINVQQYDDTACGIYLNESKMQVAVVTGHNIRLKHPAKRSLNTVKISVTFTEWLMPLDSYQENTDDYEVIFNEIIQSPVKLKNQSSYSGELTACDEKNYFHKE